MGIKKAMNLCISIVLVMVLCLSPLQVLAVTESVQAEETDAVKADVVFVIDSTGSMEDEIAGVRNGIAGFVTTLVDNDVDVRVAILEYRDIVEDGTDSTKIHRIDFSPWHSNVAEIQQTLDGIEIDGGGDTPETLVDALGYITNGDISFRSDAYKFAFVFTDASYKTDNRHGYSDMGKVVEALQSLSVSTSVVTYPEYYDNSLDMDIDYYIPSAAAALSLAESMDRAQNSRNDMPEGNSLDEGRQTEEEGITPYFFAEEQLTQEDMESALELAEGNYVNAEITSGETETVFYSFRPQIEGIYCLSAESEHDNYGVLYDSSGQMLYSNDDYSGTDFQIRAYLSAGTTYYFAVSFYTNSVSGGISLKMDYKGMAPHNCSYREIAEATNGILVNISDDFSGILSDLAMKIMEITQKSKKAIYVLPGYMGSRLYTPDGNEVWVNTDYLKNDAARYLLPGGEDSILTLNEDGEGSRVHADIGQDAYGSQDTYQALVEELKKQCGEEYDVVFFPYNWLGDLSDSARSLEQHIKTNRYEKVVFVTHSTGGLLASNYIARSRENKNIIEKAILIAAPLFGTYTALQPVETGSTQDLDEMLTNNGVSGGPFGIVHGIVHKWVKGITRNSPTTYQLFPSEEYLKMTAAIYESDMSNAVTDSGTYYSVLNGSSNINANLTNGNNRSHNYFRSTVLGGNIINVLKNADTILIGSGSGHATPGIAVYQQKLFSGTKLKDIIYKGDGDGTVMGFSAFAMRSQDKHELAYKSFDGLSHGELASDSKVLDYICGVINSNVEAAVLSDTMAEGLETGGNGAHLEEKVKFNVQSNQELVLKAYNSAGEDVDVMGTSTDEYIYSPVSEEEGDYNSLLYVPNQGWKVELYPAEDNSEPVAGSVTVSLLNEEGFKTASAKYPFSSEEAVSDTVVSVFDMKTLQVNEDTLKNLQENSAPEMEVYPTQWSIDQQVVLGEIGESSQIRLKGNDVSSKNIEAKDLQWHSADDSIVEIDGEGRITAKGYGKTVVSALQEGSCQTFNCQVTVRKYASEIHLVDLALQEGERAVLNPEFDSMDVTETDIVYDYPDNGIISIEDGVIFGLAEGSVTVHAQAEGGAETSFQAEVRKKENIISVDSVSVTADASEIMVGAQMKLQAAVVPENATDKKVSWHVQDDSVLGISSMDDSACIVTGLKQGTATVYAVTSDGGFRGNIQIVVKEKPEDNTGASEDGTGGQIGTKPIDIASCNVRLSVSSYTYDGKEKAPEVTVWDGSAKLSDGTDYMVAYSNNINAGEATVSVTGTGRYNGSMTKSFSISKAQNKIAANNFTRTYSIKKQSFPIGAVCRGDAKLTYRSNHKSVKVTKQGKVTVKPKFIGKAVITIKAEDTVNYEKAEKKITVVVNPPRVPFSAKNVKGKKILLKWKRSYAVTGYQIRYSADKKFKKGVHFITVKKNGKLSKKISKLKKGKIYYIQVRTYKTVSKKKYFSSWGNSQKVKVRK